MAEFKLFFVIIIVLFFPTAIFGQSNELYFQMYGSTPVGWYFHTHAADNKLKGFTEDLRFNFDEPKTLTGCVGKTFGSDRFNIIPEACGYAGLFHGYGPELLFNSDTKKYFMFSYIQYAKFVDTVSFGYGWLQADRKVGKRLEFGVGGQVLKEGSNPFWANLGPAVKIHLNSRFAINFVPLYGVAGAEKGKVKPYFELSYIF